MLGSARSRGYKSGAAGVDRQTKIAALRDQ
jgi:hypothetical protein